MWRVAGFPGAKEWAQDAALLSLEATTSEGHIALCFLALVMEAALERLLRSHGCEASVREALEAVEQVKAVRVELNGEVLLAQNLPPLAQKAFAAAGMRALPTCGH